MARSRTGAAVAWTSLATYWGLAGAGFLLRMVNDPGARLDDQLVPRVAWGAFPTVGALIAARQPRNPVGWLCCGIGLLLGPAFLGQDYGWYALIHRAGAVPGGLVAAWLGQWPWALATGLIAFVLLLFPDGRLVSRAWRPVAWAGWVMLVLMWTWAAFAPRPLEGVGLEAIDNPLAIGWWPAAVWVVLEGAAVLVGLLTVLAAVSMLVRFRRARGVERQQLKWFTYAAVVCTLIWVVVFLSGLDRWLPSPLAAALGLVWLGGLPAAIGVAVLRYRLYDIDRIINRTLVYGLLTALLGLGYAGMVLVGGQLFGGVTGDPPSWAVAGATLAIATAFQPARRRVQAAVDRRFNRRRYDAARTITAFSARLRDEVDLDVLAVELVEVVGRAVEPTSVSLWLRPAQGQTRLR